MGDGAARVASAQRCILSLTHSSSGRATAGVARFRTPLNNHVSVHMAEFLVKFLVIIFFMLLSRYVKYLWSAPIHFAGTDIELDQARARTIMCLLNFSTEEKAHRASRILGYGFPEVELERLENGRWNVECRRRMKPKLRSFMLLKAVVQVAALFGGGVVVFIGAQTP